MFHLFYQHSINVKVSSSVFTQRVVTWKQTDSVTPKRLLQTKLLSNLEMQIGSLNGVFRTPANRTIAKSSPLPRAWLTNSPPPLTDTFQVILSLGCKYGHMRQGVTLNKDERSGYFSQGVRHPSTNSALIRAETVAWLKPAQVWAGSGHSALAATVDTTPGGPRQP